MCWNKEVSLITYIVVTVLVIILYRRNKGSDRHLAIFSAVFVTIQLLEFFAWLSIERKQQKGSRKLNDVVTRLILLALWAQPLINTFMAYRSRSNFSGSSASTAQTSFFAKADGSPLFNDSVKYLMLIMFFIFVILMILAIKKATDKASSFETSPGNNCHLVWKRKNRKGQSFPMGNGFLADETYQSYLYMIGLFLPVLLIRPFKKGVILAVLGAIMLIIARRISSKEEFGSWWCWVAGIFVLAALLLKDK